MFHFTRKTCSISMTYNMAQLLAIWLFGYLAIWLFGYLAIWLQPDRNLPATYPQLILYGLSPDSNHN
jgi:hypothetical protein